MMTGVRIGYYLVLKRGNARDDQTFIMILFFSFILSYLCKVHKTFLLFLLPSFVCILSYVKAG